ncbi:uncharacterized protein BJ171DRAFT_295053 [Polychytrium aggregatum]|uniref:uncharacterized protein n=1 Tax=Polychytrium aggregatum TaxID=110093 RepID=UPI0022FF2DB0|nr:uncharacterized protein BJ171DRAFT_295053 [Polychytrium aggregatum]KAI9207317.1 hypothetical protein BJ171DRAFT_295053 [Polychytrium aggregatum]
MHVALAAGFLAHTAVLRRRPVAGLGPPTSCRHLLLAIVSPASPPADALRAVVLNIALPHARPCPRRRLFQAKLAADLELRHDPGRTQCARAVAWVALHLPTAAQVFVLQELFQRRLISPQALPRPSRPVISQHHQHHQPSQLLCACFCLQSPFPPPPFCVCFCSLFNSPILFFSSPSLSEAKPPLVIVSALAGPPPTASEQHRWPARACPSFFGVSCQTLSGPYASSRLPQHNFWIYYCRRRNPASPLLHLPSFLPPACIILWPFVPLTGPEWCLNVVSLSSFPLSISSYSFLKFSFPDPPPWVASCLFPLPRGALTGQIFIIHHHRHRSLSLFPSLSPPRIQYSRAAEIHRYGSAQREKQARKTQQPKKRKSQSRGWKPTNRI